MGIGFRASDPAKMYPLRGAIKLSGIQLQGGIEVGGYRSREQERVMMDKEFRGDTAARGYRSRGL